MVKTKSEFYPITRQIGTDAMVATSTLRYIRAYVASNEDWRSTRYFDSKGKPTVGVGFNLTREGARDRIAALGLDYDAVLNASVPLSDAQIDRLFTDDLFACIKELPTIFSNFDRLAPARQTVLVDMLFNMGSKKLREFANMIAAVKSGDFQKAAFEIQNSKYFSDVPARAVRSRNAMATGHPPPIVSAPHPKPIDDKSGKDSDDTKAKTDEKAEKDDKDGKEGKEEKEVKEANEQKDEKDTQDKKDVKEEKDDKEQKDEKEGKDGKESDKDDKEFWDKGWADHDKMNQDAKNDKDNKDLQENKDEKDHLDAVSNN